MFFQIVTNLQNISYILIEKSISGLTQLKPMLFNGQLYVIQYMKQNGIQH